jgi:plasmid maintenance system killer protein
MKILYRSKKLEKQLSNASEMKKAFGTMAPKVSQRKDEIIASDNLRVLMNIPAAKCHALMGDRRGEWAVSISGNFRLVFTIAQDPIPLKDDDTIDTSKVTDIKIEGTEDYH